MKEGTKANLFMLHRQKKKNIFPLVKTVGCAAFQHVFFRESLIKKKKKMLPFSTFDPTWLSSTIFCVDVSGVYLHILHSMDLSFRLYEMF